MSTGPANVSVWVKDDLVFIRINGRASFQCSVDFKTLINGLREKGHRRFVLDLADCQLMDSTFLGVLAGLGLKFNETTNGEPRSTLELLNPCPRVADLLENLGIAHLFKIIEGKSAEANRIDSISSMTPTTSCNPTRRETTQTCLEAHKLLMDLNPENVAKFKDVTRFLEEDLKKMEK